VLPNETDTKITNVIAVSGKFGVDVQLTGVDLDADLLRSTLQAHSADIVNALTSKPDGVYTDKVSMSIAGPVSASLVLAPDDSWIINLNQQLREHIKAALKTVYGSDWDGTLTVNDVVYSVDNLLTISTQANSPSLAKNADLKTGLMSKIESFKTEMTKLNPDYKFTASVTAVVGSDEDDVSNLIAYSGASSVTCSLLSFVLGSFVVWM
jgi:hypothetical protein